MLMYPQIHTAVCRTIQNYTHGHVNFCLTMAYTITSQNIDLSSWITLYTECWRLYPPLVPVPNHVT